MRAELLFWFSAAVVFYPYLGYPLALLALRLFFGRPVRRAPILPTVSLLIPAHNESRVIERKIRNALALDYPADRLEIVVASDGSSDDTVARAQELADGRRVRVLPYPQNRGKMATLNASVPLVNGEIIVFSDAPALLDPGALRQLVQSFADPKIGAASGCYKVLRAGDVSIGASEDLYWKYETGLKALESDVSSTLGAHGPFYAIRRELYPYPPAATINDDYVIFVSVLAKGYRAVYDTSAAVYEEAREMTGFGRRVRIVAGNIQQLREFGPLMRPPRPLPLFFFLSHKLARLLVPAAMLAMLIASLLLLSLPFYGAALGAQGVFYLLATWGALARLRPKILMLPFYFSMINIAAFFGLYHSLTRRRGMAWE
jgi:biofilm PGA synthesis N-glycosyltransferase PgaC